MDSTFVPGWPSCWEEIARGTHPYFSPCRNGIRIYAWYYAGSWDVKTLEEQDRDWAEQQIPATL